MVLEERAIYVVPAVLVPVRAIEGLNVKRHLRVTTLIVKRNDLGGARCYFYVRPNQDR